MRRNGRKRKRVVVERTEADDCISFGIGLSHPTEQIMEFESFILSLRAG